MPTLDKRSVGFLRMFYGTAILVMCAWAVDPEFGETVTICAAALWAIGYLIDTVFE